MHMLYGGCGTDTVLLKPSRPWVAAEFVGQRVCVCTFGHADFLFCICTIFGVNKYKRVKGKEKIK